MAALQTSSTLSAAANSGMDAAENATVTELAPSAVEKAAVEKAAVPVEKAAVEKAAAVAEKAAAEKEAQQVVNSLAVSSK